MILLVFSVLPTLVAQATPQWTPVTPPHQLRTGHTATLLKDGRVLVTGGDCVHCPEGLPDAPEPFSTAEIYNPATRKWTRTGAMAVGRTGHTATVLLDGRVLVVGGYGAGPVTEVWSPKTGQWNAAGAMAWERSYQHSAVALPDGRVVVVGSGPPELWSPDTLQWQRAKTFQDDTTAHTAVALPPTADVLVITVEPGDAPARAYRFDPVADVLIRVALPVRGGHAPLAATLTTGQVVVLCGRDARLVVWDPATGSVNGASTLAFGSDWAPKVINLLKSGELFVLGHDGDQDRAVLWNAETRRWRTIQDFPQGFTTATLLYDGGVLLLGRRAPMLWRQPAAARVVAPPRSTNPQVPLHEHVTLQPDGSVLVSGLTATPEPSGGRETRPKGAATALLPHGRVMLTAGGELDQSYFVGEYAVAATLSREVRVWDPAQDQWNVGHPLRVARTQHTATALADGRVLVVGGYGEAPNTALTSVELWDPATGLWVMAAPLAVARHNHVAVRLTDGKVLVAGGNLLDSAELWDPATGRWSSAGRMGAPRGGFAAVALPDGRVLVAGGTSRGELASAELFLPASNSWQSTGSLGVRRGGLFAGLLPDGRVLAAGGFADGYRVPGCEVWEPTTGEWTAYVHGAGFVWPQSSTVYAAEEVTLDPQQSWLVYCAPPAATPDDAQR